MSDWRQGPAHAALRAHRTAWDALHLRELFERDPGRAMRYRMAWEGFVADYSKHRITDETLALLLRLARERGVEERRAAMFAGERINATEDRPVLHVALRHRGGRSITVDGEDVMPLVASVLDRMRAFCAGVESGAIAGVHGHPFRAVVHIGIGGSDLGPAMVCEALEPYHRTGIEVRFASNVDGQDIAAALRNLEPASTLVLVASKTFTTAETLANAHTARRWLTEALGEAAVAHHFVALSANPAKAGEFGIPGDRVFGFWDWVGGRYSLWSAIGLPIALAVGFERFEELLAGAFDMDEHFRRAPLEENLPVLLALIGFWYVEYFGWRALAVLPYDRRLRRLPAYLQQADMESNGKSVTMDGQPVGGSTGPVVFGEPGTNAQHSFFQLLHQSPDVVPADFIAAATLERETPPHHAMLLANFLAQTEALMRGKTQREAAAELRARGASAAEVARLAPHKAFEGNRPTTTIVLQALTPTQLGRLLALYEHKIFVQGVLWGVNSFDQWGVELGKALAQVIQPELDAPSVPAPGAHDASTAALLAQLRAWRNAS